MKSMTIAAHNKWSTCAPLTTTAAAYAKRQLNAAQKGYQNPKGSERKETTTEAALATVRCSCLAYFCMATGKR